MNLRVMLRHVIYFQWKVHFTGTNLVMFVTFLLSSVDYIFTNYMYPNKQQDKEIVHRKHKLVFFDAKLIKLSK